MILRPSEKRHSIYTISIHTASASLIKKYLINNSFCQNQVQIPFDSANLPTQLRESPNSYFLWEYTHLTRLIDSFQSLYYDLHYMNMFLNCLHFNSNMEYEVISSNI